MKIVVLTNDSLKEELLSFGMKEGTEIFWTKNISEWKQFKDADAFIDLLFEMKKERIAALKGFLPKLVLINSMMPVQENFIRFNGWHTFLKREVIEVIKMSDAFTCFNKKIEVVPDIPGFISARVITMIINEAYFALEENVSTKNEIDVAMKLGTNYPYGPFEWSEKIGLKNIYQLLSELSKANSRYQPSSLLKKEVLV